ncbi:scramblase family protein [Pseudohyphozyma bogoriensis]|nr:scramblase family protein [Pseudohyphozyma bogoriensis]
MMNIFLGFEEANKYQLLAPDGTLLGYLMEEDLGFGAALMRQAVRTHRAFKATVLDTQGNVLLRIRRPFSWINSRIFISVPSPDGTDTEANERVIGEAQQEWHLYRRKYNQFVKRGDEMVQFAETDSGFLAWDFWLKNDKGEVIGSINRNFAGFGRELFTDTGQYVLRFEGVIDELANPAIESPPPPDALPPPTSSSSTSLSATEIEKKPETGVTTVKEISGVPAVLPLPSITFDQRAVMLACAVSIDFDYFTRQRGGLGSGMGMWMPMPMGGTTTTDAGVGGAEAGEAGALEGAAAGGATDLDPLPSREESEGWESGPESVDRDGGREGWGWGNGSRDSGGWSDEVMQDPWAQKGGGGGDTEGGTWSWGDLFPDE